MAPSVYTQLAITYEQPVNASANVTVATVNVNIAAVLGTDAVVGGDYTTLVGTIMLRGYWNGAQFIPARRISLITAS